MTSLTLSAARSAVLWRTLWAELDTLERHPDNVPYRTGREAVLAEMREVRDMLREINDSAKVVSPATFAEMLNAYLFTSPFTLA